MTPEGWSRFLLFVISHVVVAVLFVVVLVARLIKSHSGKAD